jgi:hypothetical protein
MYTALAVVALMVGNLSGPNWLDDYKAAQAQVSVAGKPMAVFVGSGQAGYQSAIRDGFDPAISKLLAEKFVCLYVDASTAKGKSLGAALQVGDRGVVLSDRTGRTQAYSAAGTITRAELNRALLAYSDIQLAQTTDTPKTTGGSSAGTSATGTASGAGPTPAGTVIVGPGGPMGVPPPGYIPGPVRMGGPGYMGGPGHMGGYGYNGGCGQPMGGCGQSMGGCGQSMGGCGSGGWGGGHGCGLGGGFGHSMGGGHGCCFFGGGWGGGHGGCGGGMGHGFGGGWGGGGWGGGWGGGMGHGCGGCK